MSFQNLQNAINNNPFTHSYGVAPEKIELKLRELAKINSLVIEFYDLEYHLIASNLGKFDTKKLNQDVINHLKKKRF